jgi:hypothetical protein
LAEFSSSAPTGSATSVPADVSPRLVAWMQRHRLSLRSSYRTGRLLSTGARSDVAATLSRALFAGAMGSAASSKYSCLVLVVLGRRRIAGSAAAETYRRER